MKDIRIGNDILVSWSLYRDGEAYDLTYLPVTLYLKNAYGKKKVENVTIDGNKVSWTFFGKDQKNTGKYSMVLVVREGKEGMASTDVCDFVQLVSCSCQVSGTDDENVETEVVELTSEVDFSPIVDTELSEVSANPIANMAVAKKFTEQGKHISDAQTSIKNLSESVTSLETSSGNLQKDKADKAELAFTKNANNGAVLNNGFDDNSAGKLAVAIGRKAQAPGYASFGSGYAPLAGGDASVAMGYGAETQNNGEAALGKWNKSGEDTIFSVGIGESMTTRKNALEVKQNGDVYIEGVEGRIQDKIDFEIGNATQKQLDTFKALSIEDLKSLCGVPFSFCSDALLSKGTAERIIITKIINSYGYRFFIYGVSGIRTYKITDSTGAGLDFRELTLGQTIEDFGGVVNVINTISKGRGENSACQIPQYDTFEKKNELLEDEKGTFIEADALGDYAVALGGMAAAVGKRSVAQGHRCVAEGETSHAEGNCAVVKYLDETHNGYGSHAEGYSTVVTGVYSHAEGSKSKVMGANSHAEGMQTSVDADGAHAEGYLTFANEGANCSHAEGNNTQTNGLYSHAEGLGTKTKEGIIGQHAEGYYNAETDSVLVVGCGTSDEDRKNALEVTQDGRIFAKGLGNYDGTSLEASDLKAVIDSKADSSDVYNKTELNNRINADLVQKVQVATINGQSLINGGNIEIAGGESIEVDSELSETSENPVQNKVITEALNVILGQVGSMINELAVEVGNKVDADFVNNAIAEAITTTLNTEV